MNPSVVMSLRSLELRAKLVVDGFRTGLNKSPRHGFSVEFSEYRQYAQGDDPRFLDWKLFARTDRSYIRLFEDETNLRCYIVLDVSRSMTFGSGEWSKYEYARTIAASLAWLLNKQGDAVGLTTFDDEVKTIVPARYRPGQLRRLMVSLEEQPSGKQTRPAVALEDAAQRLRKRGLVILISDLLAPVQELGDGLRLLRGCLHDMVVFQVLDRAEKNLTFDGPRLFEDLETDQKIYADPNVIRNEYVNRLEAHNTAVRQECDSVGAAFRQLVTDEPLELALAEFLQARRQIR
ncbi:MAG: DUF58 domain-containing protein [Planctomycetaceae bacterium]|nr:DUF58 domain-containing protein [Planctomycetaceae bacterium]